MKTEPAVGGSGLTAASRRFYPKQYVFSFYSWLHVLLSTSVGVRLGENGEILYSPPGKAGGFCFHPLMPSLISTSLDAGRIEQILSELSLSN